MWTTPPWQHLRALTRWHVQSQQVARRNALLASTALAARRKEHADVEEFLAERAPYRRRSGSRTA